LVYFISDTHFFHENIIKYCNRPFTSLEEMNRTLIENWNATVQQDDEIYIVGDFAFGKPETVHQLTQRLNGKKYLIRGNHDKFLKDYEQYESDFEWIKDYAEITVDKIRYILFHYPIVEWAHYYRGAIHCYGHIHGHPAAQGTLENLHSLPSQPGYRLPGRCVNVGVDVNGFRPISSHEVILLAEANCQ